VGLQKSQELVTYRRAVRRGPSDGLWRPSWMAAVGEGSGGTGRRWCSTNRVSREGCQVKTQTVVLLAVSALVVLVLILAILWITGQLTFGGAR